MSSSYYTRSSSFSQVNDEVPKTSQKIFSMNQNYEDINGEYREFEDKILVNKQSFNSLEGLKNILLEFQNNQHQLRNTYQQSITNTPLLDGGGYIRNIDSSYYKKHGGTINGKINPIEKINPQEVIKKKIMFNHYINYYI